MSKKLIIRAVVLISTAVSLFFVPWNILAYWISPLQSNIQDEIDNALNHEFEAIMVYVDEAGVKNTYTTGYKSKEDKLLVEADTIVKIASISKLYVAVAATKVVEADLLSLDDTLSDLLPEFKERIENSDEITLKMLLQHRSGIPNFVVDEDFDWDHMPTSNSATLELVLDDPADFAPDKKYSYSNTNYLLIGAILDKTLGYSHHDFIESEIFIPLGLKKTFNLLSEVSKDDVISGYTIGYEFDLKDKEFLNPGGSMLATLEDVGIFIRALNDGTLLTKDEQELYSTVYTYDHTGLLPGYQSFAKYYEDIDTVVIQFNNTSGGYMWTKAEMLYKNILKIIRK